MKEMLYAVRCLKSNEDMILALAGQFKQLSHDRVITKLPFDTSSNLLLAKLKWEKLSLRRKKQNKL